MQKGIYTFLVVSALTVFHIITSLAGDVTGDVCRLVEFPSVMISESAIGRDKLASHHLNRNPITSNRHAQNLFLSLQGDVWRRRLGNK